VSTDCGRARLRGSPNFGLARAARLELTGFFRAVFSEAGHSLRVSLFSLSPSFQHEDATLPALLGEEGQIGGVFELARQAAKTAGESFFLFDNSLCG